MRIRNAVFWLHLAAGLLAGAVIFVMSVTGMLLMYERQVTEWADRGLRSSPPSPGAARLPVETLAARVVETQPGKSPSAVTMQADPAAPVAVSLGRERTVFVNPYTGKVLGEGSRKLRAFFRGLTDWHRWLGAKDENRRVARAVTGAANLVFLTLVVSGIYLWLPRVWTRRQVRSVAWFRRGLTGKARNFNWHNVTGLWVWVPLFLIVLTGVVMSFPWANALLFRLAGDKPPQERSEGRGSRDGGEKKEVKLDGLNALWAVAERQAPGWQSITLRLPPADDEPVTFTILSGQRGRPDLRAQLTLDRGNAEIVRWEPFASQGPGRRLRSWARWVHTGEAGGVLGQTVAGVAAAGAAMLVWTGWAMAWRRLFSQQRQPRAASPETQPEVTSEPEQVLARNSL